MFRVHYLIYFLLILHSCSEKNQNKVSTNIDDINPTALGDTTFLINKAIGEKFRYQVYESYSLSHYQQLIPTVSDSTFSLMNNPYGNSHSMLHNEVVDLYDLPTKWTEIIKINGKYYLNLPSDRCRRDQKIVTDSCMILLTCEGPMAKIIREVEKINHNKYRISFDKTYKNHELFITIVDRSKGLATWHNDHSQKLYAFLKDKPMLPISVANCNGNKCPDDIKSEYINIEALLNKIE